MQVLHFCGQVVTRKNNSWTYINVPELIWRSEHIMVIIIATDKRGYPHNIFLISRQKHMLWVLIRSASPRRF